MDLKHVIEHHILDTVWSRIAVFGGFTVPWSKHVLMMLIAAGILIVLMPMIARGGGLFRLLLAAVETLVVFVRDDIVKPNLGEEGNEYLPYFCSLFFFILVCNVLGLIPFGATATGNIAVTATLAATTFVLIHFAGVRHHGAGHYFGGLVPHGVPLWLWPLMFPIELIGFLTKAFALCIRLFANMIAGHIVMTVLLALIIIFGQLKPAVGYGVAFASVPLAIFVSFLEIFVAFLQAYIFTFLTAIFVGGAIHQH